MNSPNHRITPMSKVGLNIKRRLGELEKNQDWLARLSGVSQVAVSKVINGVTKKSRHLPDIANVLGLTVEQLHSGRWGEPLGVHEDAAEYRVSGGRPTNKVPLISFVQAGSWEEAVDSYQLNDAAEWLDVPLPHSASAYCLEVSGSSMEPEYYEGGKILVDPTVEAMNGDDVVVRTPDGKVTFKRLQRSAEGSFLIAVNPDFPNRIIEMPDESVFCGVVTGYWVDKRRHR